MKRSRRISLVLMGTATIALAACDDTEQAGVFSSVEECKASGIYTEEHCNSSLDEAKKQHAKVAPKFSTLEDCEAEFGPGRCSSPHGSQAVQQGGGSGSFWMPLMMGYLVGKALNNSQPLYRPYERPQTGYSGGSGSWGGWRTGDNVQVSDRTGAQTVSSSATRASTPKTTTVSRGGFGARASSVGAAS